MSWICFRILYIVSYDSVNVSYLAHTFVRQKIYSCNCSNIKYAEIKVPAAKCNTFAMF